MLVLKKKPVFGHGCSSDDWAGFQMYVDAMLNSSPGDRSLKRVSEEEVGSSTPIILCKLWEQTLWL